LIQLIDVHKAFGPKRVLEGFTLDVHEGETMVIIGYSGTGKSVAIKHIVGLLEPDSGRVIVDDQEVPRLSRRELYKLRARIGYVFQFASLLPTLRLVDNVALPALLGRRQVAAEAHDKACRLLAQMGLGDYLDAYPSEISAGEQRRAVIARALINDPAILLADEPTADLDEHTEMEIMDELLAVNRERRTTLLLVTHNLALAEQAGQIVHLASGRIVR